MALIALCFAFMSLVIGCGYLWIASAIGQEAGLRNTRYGLVGLLTLFLITIMMPQIASQLSEKTLSNLHILYWLPIIGFGSWGLSWPYRKQEFGDLLLDAGRTWQNKVLFWIGLIEAGIATFITWLSSRHFLASLDSAGGLLQILQVRAPQVIFWWTIAILLISTGLSKLELREKGLCFLWTFVSWQQISAYWWENSQQNTLTIKVRRRLLLSPSFMSIRTPARYRDAIERIVNAHIPQS
ncbi:MAG: hypothetical protein AAFQ95_11950 [Cyanobacteria bacterium J06621_3]